jgi:nucleotide-binding universal stress UspA family protein
MSDAAPTYLVIIDGTEESRVALRFAAMRAGHVGGRVMLLHVMRPPEFMPLGGVQAAIAAEAETEGEALLASHADEAEALVGTRPEVRLRCGDPTGVITEFLASEPSVRALVLATAAKGAPGPLVTYFAGERAGQLPCVTIIVPGGLPPERLEMIT